MTDIKLENTSSSLAALKEWIRLYYSQKSTLSSDELLKLFVAMKYYMSVADTSGTPGYGYGYGYSQNA